MFGVCTTAVSLASSSPAERVAFKRDRVAVLSTIDGNNYIISVVYCGGMTVLPEIVNSPHIGTMKTRTLEQPYEIIYIDTD